MSIKEIDSQKVPSDKQQHTVHASKPTSEKKTYPPVIESRSHRIDREAIRCLFPIRSTNASFAHWSKSSLKAAEHRADMEREIECLAGRWNKLRRTFNDWLDEIYLKRNANRLDRTKGLEFEAKIIDALDPYSRVLAHLLCHGEFINAVETSIDPSRDFRSIRWSWLQPKPSGTDQAAA